LRAVLRRAVLLALPALPVQHVRQALGQVLAPVQHVRQALVLQLLALNHFCR
jgi:hypothetical protein